MNRQPWPWPWTCPPHTRRRLRRLLCPVTVLELEDRTLLDGTAVLLAPNGTAAGTLADPGDTAMYQVVITEPGRLTVQTHATSGGSLDTRTTLLGPDNQLLVQSDAAGLKNPDDLIVQHLDPGPPPGPGSPFQPETYFLEVEGLRGGTGTFTITTAFQPAADPFVPIGVGTDPRGSTTADFNGDGLMDLAVANSSDNTVSILLGLGDGTFQELQDGSGHPIRPTVGTGPVALVAGDFNGDGIPDLAVVDSGANASGLGPQGPGDVAILLGNGDGTFRPAQPFGSLANPDAIAAGDFTGDGRLDLAVASAGSNTLTIFMGNGDGTFTQGEVLTTGATPDAVAAGDFTGDGRLGLAVANRDDNTVSIFTGRGDGTFAPGATLAAGPTPSALVAGDFNGGGHLDLAVADANIDPTTGTHTSRGTVAVLLGNGDGTFQPAVSYAVGFDPVALTAGDFNGDGHLDLATANHDSLDVSVLLGTGTGTFFAAVTTPTSANPFSLVAGDFNADHRDDLATAESGPDGGVETVLVGRGNGTFEGQTGAGQPANPVGTMPVAVATGDFNGDGIPDLVTANAGSGDLSVLLGNGDGTFTPQLRLPLGGTPTAVVTGDFNGDGRADIAVALAFFNAAGDPLVGRVAIFLGNGDGTFARTTNPATGAGLLYTVGPDPVALVADDFNGDGSLDLAVANAALTDDPTDPQPAGPGSLSVLLGDGHGGFAPATTWAVGKGKGPFTPVSLVTGDFNGDGSIDIATADRSSNTVSVLLGNEDGTFKASALLAAGSQPGTLVADDFAGNGRLDLAVGNQGSGDVSVFLGNGDGTFQPQARYDLNGTPYAVVAGDFNGDGVPDLAAADGQAGNDRVLLGNGDGTFGPVTAYGAGDSPVALAAADFNGDGLTDLANVDPTADAVAVQQAALAGGALFFAEPDPAAPERATPLVADFNGDGRLDSVVLSQSGRILLRLGKGRPGAFAPPVAVNPGRPARAVAVVHAGAQVLLAATDQVGDAITLYAFDPHSGKPVVQGEITIPGASGLTRIAAGDLTGQFPGFDDLAVLYTLNARERVSVFTADGQGGFAPQGLQIDPDGNAPADLALVNLTGHANGVRDILVTDQGSGDVNVLVNDGSGDDFSAHEVFRAGAGLYGVTNPEFYAVQSAEGTAQVVAGDFTGDGRLDLVAADPGTDTLTLLPGRGDGSLANPVRLALGFTPTALAAGRFDQTGFLDLAVLDGTTGQVHIFLNNGAGFFTAKTQIDPLTGLPGPLVVGSGATGLSVVRLRPGGPDDLQVGNVFGDVLTLLGNGDGTFQPPARAEARVPLVTTSLNGVPEVIVANQAADQISSRLRQPGTRTFTPGGFLQDRRDGLIGPGALKLADLTGDGIPDLIVANSGANSILVYPGLPGGGFGPPHAYFVGTNPVDIVVKDLNGDGRPDLAVVNQGSDDVSILFGLGNGTFRPGGRFRAGSGPIAAAFRDVRHDGIPDLIVTNGQDGTVSDLPGVGGGFYDDSHAVTQSVPGNPVLVADNQGYLVTQAGAVILSDPFDGSQAPFTTVFTSDSSRQVTFVEPFLFPGATTAALFAARSDGSVSLLTAGTGEPYAEAQVFRDPGLVDPSTLAAVPLPDQNELDVYATDSASGEPVVFTLELGVPVFVAENIAPLAASLGVLQPLSSSDVAVVPILVTGPSVAGLLGAETEFAPALQEAPTELEVPAFDSAAGLAEGLAAEPAAGDEAAASAGLLALAGGADDTDAGDAGADPAAAAAPFLENAKGRSGQDQLPTPDELLTPEDGTPGDRKPDPLAPGLPEEKPSAPRGERSPDRPSPRAVPKSDSHENRNGVPRTGPAAVPAEKDVAAALADALPFWWEKGPGGAPLPGPDSETRAGQPAGEELAAALADQPGPVLADPGKGAEVAEILAAALVLAGVPGIRPEEEAPERKPPGGA